MSTKQDRTYTRTASDLERKLGVKEKFAQVMGIAENAQRKAEEAEGKYENLDQETVFNLLTNNGQLEGIYRGDDGEIYINASYIASGIISSKDGKLQINLQGGSMPIFNTGISTNGLKVRGDSVGAKDVFTLDATTLDVSGTKLDTFRFLVQDVDGNLVGSMNELFQVDGGTIKSNGIQFRLNNDSRTRMVNIATAKDSAYIALENNSTGEVAGSFSMQSNGTTMLTCDKVTGLSDPVDSRDAVRLGFYRLSSGYTIPANGGVVFVMPEEATPYKNYLGVIRSVNAAYTAVYLIAGNHDGNYSAIPIVANENVGVTANNGKNLTISNNTSYEMEYLLRLVNLG